MDSNLAILRRSGLLASLPEETRQTVLERAWRTSVRRRDFVYVPGDAADAVFAVLRGRVRILLLSEDGREATLALLEPGDVFGEEALTDGAARTTAAQAWEETQLAAFPVADLRAAASESPEALWALASLVAARRRASEELLDGLAFRDVGARLARCLLQLAERHGARRLDGHVVLRLRLTHQDLAMFCCTTRETTSLTLEKFKQEGWLVAQGRAIVICDLEALRHRSGLDILGSKCG